MAMPTKPSAAGIEEEYIRVAAYHIWNEEGQPEGKAEEHWSRARDQLKAVKPAKPKPAAKPAAKTVAKPAAKAPAKSATTEAKVAEKKKPAPARTAKAKSKD